MSLSSLFSSRMYTCAKSMAAINQPGETKQLHAGNHYNHIPVLFSLLHGVQKYKCTSIRCDPNELVVCQADDHLPSPSFKNSLLGIVL